MAGLKCLFLRCVLLLVTAISAHPAVDGVSADASESPPNEQFEAAFQGRCGPGSPCEHLCFELHDGTFECDCRTGFVLRHDGYGCFEANATAEPPPVTTTTVKAEATAPEEEEDILYQKVASFSAERDFGPSDGPSSEAPSPSPIGVRFVSAGPGLEAHAVPTPPPQEICLLDCGPGSCLMEDLDEGKGADMTARGVGGGELDSPSRRHRQRCQCPLGRGGERCERETSVVTPHFTGQSYVAFPALKDAYKAVRLSLEFRPDESASDGIILLAGERDDMAGDFMAIIIRENGDVEFWFDCGSGVGVVRAAGRATKGTWNRLRLSRHRWDAWLSLNDADRTHGRSKGLFSRITFREPLFIGGPGNTTGLLGGVVEDNGSGAAKLPTDSGFKGCVRNLEVNGRTFRFVPEDAPGQHGDAMKGFDVGECEDDDSNTGCNDEKNSGTCPKSVDSPTSDIDDSARAPCPPSGRTETHCKGPVIHVPAFNGTSYLQHPGLGSFSVSSWLEIEITFKALSLDGLLLYNGRQGDGVGDFVALHISNGILIFTFDLGTGSAHIRSSSQISLGTWHEARVSRTGRLAILSIDGLPGNRAMTPGAFTQLSLGPKHPLYIGGVPMEHAELISPKVAQHHGELIPADENGVGGGPPISSFIGCIQKVVVNNRVLDLVVGSQAGVNIESCPHPCRAGPCPHGAICVPQKEFYSCECHSGIMNHGNRGEECGGSDQLVPEDEDEEEDDVLEDDEEEGEDDGEGGEGPLAEPLLGRRRRMREGGGGKGPQVAELSMVENEVAEGDEDEGSAVPGFTGDSYLHYTDVDTIKRIVNNKIDINMRFKVTSESGVLLWSGQHGGASNHHTAAGQTGDFLALGLRAGYLHLRFNLGSGEVELEYNASRVDDGLWHRVRATRTEQEGTIVVDSGPVVSKRSPGRLRQLNTNTGLYIGGVESVEKWTQGQYSSGVVGCISDLVLDGESPLPLPLPPKSAVTMKTSRVLQHDLKLRKEGSRQSLRKTGNTSDSAHLHPSLSHFSTPSLSVIGHNILRCH